MTRVMIAADGSDTDRQLAAVAHRLFGDDAEYWAVNVQVDTSLTPGSAGWPAVYGGTMIGYGMAYPYQQLDPHRAGETAAVAAEERAHEVARDAVEGIEDADVIAERGDPPTAIRRAAAEHAVDVIVVGASTRSWWSTLLSPSVADDVLDDSEIPVLVVRPERSGEPNQG